VLIIDTRFNKCGYRELAVYLENTLFGNFLNPFRNIRKMMDMHILLLLVIVW